MSTVAGVFSETLLQNTIAKAEELMFGDRIDLQYQAQVEAGKAFLAQQTANVKVLENPKKDIVLQVWWTNTCEIEAQDCNPCEFGGVKSSTNADTYTIDECKEAAFTVDENDFLTNYADYEDHIAKLKVAAKKVLAEYVTRYFIARLNAWAGVNVQDGFQGTVVGTDTFIPASYWTPELFAYFNQIALRNQLTMPAFVSGANLYQASLIANKNVANADGKGQSAMMGAINPFFDLQNIDQVNTPDLVSYLISKGAVAFGSKAIYPMNSPIQVSSDIKGWGEENGFLPGLYESWKYKAVCSNDRTIHYFVPTIRFGAFLNPTGCDGNNTGILRFVCGTGS
jgi:hypothetical protein